MIKVRHDTNKFVMKKRVDEEQSYFQGLLHDVIAVLVLCHGLQQLVSIVRSASALLAQHCADELAALPMAAMLQAFLHHIAGKFVCAEFHNVVLQPADDLLSAQRKTCDFARTSRHHQVWHLTSSV